MRRRQLTNFGRKKLAPERLVVDAIAPKESIASLADEWTAEFERRAARVRSGASEGRPTDEVFDRLEAKLRAR